MNSYIDAALDDKTRLNPASRMLKLLRVKHFWMLVVVLVLSLALFSPVTYYESRVARDYIHHNAFAATIGERGKTTIPHFLYEALILVVQAITHWGLTSSGFVVTLASQVVSSVIIYWLIREVFSDYPGWKTSLLSLLIALAVMLVAPINIVSWSQQKLYLGYIATSVYHNPTMLLLKPLTLLLFLQLIKAFKPTHHSSLRIILLAAILTILSSLAKPNYIIALLPILAIFCTYRLYRNQTVNWSIIIFGVVIPGVFVLFSQYVFNFVGVTTRSVGIMFAPFVIMGHYTDQIPLRFLLSITFPMIVYLLYFKNAIRQLDLNLAWLIFGAGALITYFLAEGKPDLGLYSWAGNFTWSGQITLFILFIFTMIFFLRQNSGLLDSARMTPNLRVKGLIVMGVFALHLIAGVFWYYTQTMMADPSVWW